MLLLVAAAAAAAAVVAEAAGGGGDRESEINDRGGRVRRQKCQSVFTEAHYSCFETHKLSPGEQITGATAAAAAAAANEQRVLHGGLFIIIITFFFFLTQDLALIHSHSSDVLTPKGPCPAVTEQLTPHHTLPSPARNFSYRPACSAE